MHIVSDIFFCAFRDSQRTCFSCLAPPIFVWALAPARLMTVDNNSKTMPGEQLRIVIQIVRETAGRR